MIGITQTFSATDTTPNIDEPVATYFATLSGGTLIIPSSHVVTTFNKNYFTYNDGIFTCIKAFTGFARIYAVGNVRNNIGSPKSGTANAYFYKNDTSLVSCTSTNSLSEIIFNVGDTCCLKAKISGDTTAAVGAVGLIILY